MPGKFTIYSKFFISFWIYFMEINFDPNNNEGYLKFNKTIAGV